MITANMWSSLARAWGVEQTPPHHIKHRLLDLLLSHCSVLSGTRKTRFGDTKETCFIVL